MTAAAPHAHTLPHTHTHTRRAAHTDTVCEAPSGLKVLSQRSGDTTAVKLPRSPAKAALSHVSQQSSSLSSSHPTPSLLSLGPDILSHTLRSDAALSYSVAVKKRGPSLARRGVECPVTPLSIEVRERASIEKKERGGGGGGGVEEEGKN